MQTGQIIMKLRSEAGFTQAGLADALNVSRELVSKWETGKRLPEYRLILKMAELFSVDPEALMPKESILATELSKLLPDNYPSDGDILKKDLNQFLSMISLRDRRIFIFRYYYLMEFSEIGEKYGIKANHVRMILTRVRRKLKQYLKEEY